MAVPALKRESHSSGPVLRLLKGGGRQAVPRASRTRRGGAAEVAHYRRLFQGMLALLIVVMGFSLLRVQVTVQATEAALAAGSLKEQIEDERILTESLEADRVALATPSRIESIAQGSMGMGAADDVRYLELPPVETKAPGNADPEPDSAGETTMTGERISGVLADVMEMAAGEAQVLLVGDAGLASSR